MEQTLLQTAIEQIENTIKFQKCHKCGCQQGTIKAVEKNLPNFSPSDQEILKALIERARATFKPIEYDCLGCKVCFPSIVTNEIMAVYPSVQIEDDGCASDSVNAAERTSWPLFPGSYEVNRYEASVAICTLNSKDLIPELMRAGHAEVSMVGSLNTENLGIERIISNTISNPNIRFLILCGDDSEQKIGHLPGQSLVSLFQNGVDEGRRIVGAKGKRPVLKNVASDAITQFRKQIELVDMTGCLIPSNILKMADYCGKKHPGPFTGGAMKFNVEKIEANAPKRLVLDSLTIPRADVKKRLAIIPPTITSGQKD